MALKEIQRKHILLLNNLWTCNNGNEIEIPKTMIRNFGCLTWKVRMCIICVTFWLGNKVYGTPGESNKFAFLINSKIEMDLKDISMACCENWTKYFTWMSALAIFLLTLARPRLSLLALCLCSQLCLLAQFNFHLFLPFLFECLFPCQLEIFLSAANCPRETRNISFENYGFANPKRIWCLRCDSR